MHELDERLLPPNGAFAVPTRATVTLELHDRLRADYARTLRSVCGTQALQLLATDRPDMFVYRQSSDGAVFLLQLALSGAAAERQRVSRSGSVSQISGVMMSRSASQSDVSAPPSAAASERDSARFSVRRDLSFESGREPAQRRRRRCRRRGHSRWHWRTNGGGALAVAAGAAGRAAAEQSGRGGRAARDGSRRLGDDRQRLLALAQHLRHQLDELTLRALIVLLQRTPESRLSAADLRFLRPPGAPPLATAVLPLPSSLGDGATASTGNLESTAQAPMLAWLRAAGGRLRPVGWHPLSLAHASGEGEALALLHLPPAPTKGGRLEVDALPSPQGLVTARGSRADPLGISSSAHKGLTSSSFPSMKCRRPSRSASSRPPSRAKRRWPC